MRRYIKRTLLEAIVKIQKSVCQIEEMVNRGLPAEQIMAILVSEQEAAVMIGERIEQEEGEETGADIIHFLEEYCELLWLFSQTSEQQEHKRLLGEMNDVIGKAKSLLNGLREQYEVVFLPYKASLWDCMESVWMAVKDDPDCIPYVIPVPYYERKDGQLTKACYEADLMPEYVETTHYDNYSLEERHPEIVYIHNPYDGSNPSTCVHPAYFSLNLRQYTDMLVYIPYFLSGIGNYDVKHRKMPVYQNVDKIIVQDESKLDGLKGSVPKEKLLVLGNPKADRIVRLEEERQHLIENVIPKNWKEKIQGKKVFLFYISTSAILQNSKTVLDKIRYIISTFEQRKDVVLLWRANPTIEVTLKSENSEIYQEYMQIKKEFIKADRGIWDETGDVGISATIADAYIGENGSFLVHYFGMAGKPILSVNWDIIAKKTETERRVLFVASSYSKDNKICFTPYMKGLEYWLYCLDLESGKLVREMVLPGTIKKGVTGGSYSGITEVNGKLILAGAYGKETYIYDKKKKTAMRMLLSDGYRGAAFQAVIPWNDYVILVPSKYPGVVKVNVNTYEKTMYTDGWNAFFEETEESVRTAMSYTTKDKYLYITTAEKSKILIVNMETGDYEIKSAGKYDFGYAGVVYDGKYFWLSAWKKNCIIRLEETTGKIMEISYKSDAESNLVRMVDYKDMLIVVFLFDEKMLFIDKKTGRIMKQACPFDTVAEWEKASYTVNSYAEVRKLDENRVLVYRGSDSSYIVWNPETEEYRIYPLRMSIEDMLSVEKKEIEAEMNRGIPYFLNETNVEIDRYIDYVQGGAEAFAMNAGKAYEKCMEKAPGTIGMEIHKAIKNDIIIL